jgi:hypothetical protein
MEYFTLNPNSTFLSGKHTLQIIEPTKKPVNIRVFEKLITLQENI